MLIVLLALCTLALIRISTVSANNTEAIQRLQVVEAEVQDIINQGLLDCPNRAQARDVLRTVLLADPDLSDDDRALIDSKFQVIHCD